MPLVNVVIALIVVGVLLWLVNTYIPMNGKIKQILNAVVVIAVVVWLLQAFGLIGGLTRCALADDWHAVVDVTIFRRRVSLSAFRDFGLAPAANCTDQRDLWRFRGSVARFKRRVQTQ